MSALVGLLVGLAIVVLTWLHGFNEAQLRQGRRHRRALDCIRPGDSCFWERMEVYELCVQGEVSDAVHDGIVRNLNPFGEGA